MNPIHCQSCGCTPKPGEWSNITQTIVWIVYDDK